MLNKLGTVIVDKIDINVMVTKSSIMVNPLEYFALSQKLFVFLESLFRMIYVSLFFVGLLYLIQTELNGN